jgi:hypothetical protein
MSAGQRYLLWGAVSGVVAGGMIFIVGLKERSLAATASKASEEIALKDLIARGPDGNPNIILKDFALCENYVCKTRGTRWDSVWIPAVPRDAVPQGQGMGAKQDNIQALIFTINARNEQDLLLRCDQPRLPALVTNRMVSLGSEEKKLLQQSYPGTDFSRCLIIQEGREPASAVKQSVMIGGGGLLALIGTGLLGLIGVQWYRERSRPRSKRGDRRDEDWEDDRQPRRRSIRDHDDEDDEEPPRRAAKSRRDDEEEPDRRRRSRRPRRDEED